MTYAPTIKIGCPTCGAVLTVGYVPGLEKGMVTCPICRTKSPFTNFRKIQPAPNQREERTEYPGMGQQERTEVPTDDTMNRTHTPTTQYAVGQLREISTGRVYKLKLGRNVIGREAKESSATIGIVCSSKRMSREHLVIEVENIQGFGTLHRAYLYKEKVNATYVDNAKLSVDDKIRLNDGNIIKLPDCELRFELPDEDETELT